MKYKNEYTKEISFPLGGIGSGSIGLSGNGRLVDWEIFNRAAKGSLNGYSHFAVKAVADGKTITKILNGDTLDGYNGRYGASGGCAGYGYGLATQSMSGFPHFRNMEFDGRFPTARIKFFDEDFPATVRMTAFNPFIPNDVDNSSIPAAFFEIEIENTVSCPIDYQIALTVANPFSVSQNSAQRDGGFRMLHLKNAGDEPHSSRYGDLTVATDAENATVQAYWYRGSWQDGIVTYWNDFNRASSIPERNYGENGSYDHGTLVASLSVGAKSTKKARFVIAWNVPNCVNDWSVPDGESAENLTWKNYYTTLFEDSRASARFALAEWDSLYERTMRFECLLHDSTLPPEVIDAASANLSVLKSPTVLRLSDGTFYGWEGVGEAWGSCEGTCQHVWNYAYALCFLFPESERSIRDAEFRHSTDEDSRMGFRLMLPLGRKMTDFRACLDGQMGAVIKCYREWKLSGDTAWLSSHWNDIKKVLAYAWNDKNPDRWDADRDGVLEGRQHHTLDMELFGPSSWLEGMYLAALKAAVEMARFLEDADVANEYAELYEKGKKWTAQHLFNGEYFVQKIDLADKRIVDAFGAENYWNDEAGQIKYQIANGSAIDQLLAQWHADLIGMGDIFDEKQVESALCSMMRNNFKESMRDFANPWRIFSLNDEAGAVICDYPDGTEKPKIPIPYCEETMTGFEYAFAGLLCSRGKVEDGLRVVRAIRDRYDGKKRNPWNEIECGSNYARSMASYALIPILSGFTFDLPHDSVGFAPYQTENFACVWSVSGAWGGFEMHKTNARFYLEEGKIRLSSFGIEGFAGREPRKVTIDGEEIPFTYENGKVGFDRRDVCRELVIEA